ncbi:MAG: glycosyltransferase family 1 protein [Proteobacteria bacterium]|nr:glycosyltransferase family 1 protein [Pseudomonadota bacterium]
MKTIAIVGTVGIPASYGGFETLAENLASFHQTERLPGRLVVYCSARAYPDRSASCHGAELCYVKLDANGVASILYDMVCLFSAAVRRSDVILLLGVSGAIALPLLRLFSRTRLVTNIDGLEWKRAKWSGPARWFLRFSERLAVRFSHEVISDNAAIAEHVADSYGRSCHVIAYGGDHAVSVPIRPFEGQPLPERFALALCRIEPENNVAMILDAFSRQSSMPLAFIGNWENSEYGQDLRQRYGASPQLHLLDPIYDLGVLRGLRERAALYIHGHSAGGTNPSLVEMMHFGKPVLAFDCIFNRYTTDGKAFFFRDEIELQRLIETLDPDRAEQAAGKNMRLVRRICG